MSSASDSGMVKMMAVVVFAIVVLGFAAALAARMLASDDNSASGTFLRNALIERISPSGGVRTSAEEMTAAATEVEPEVDTAAAEEAAAAAVAELGKVPELGLTDKVKQAVDGGCAGCHISGIAGAPKLGDAEAWQPRLDTGMAALTASVANGLNAMPARGGSTLTDLEIPVAIQYLLSK